MKNEIFVLAKEKWDEVIKVWLADYNIYAPIFTGSSHDYQLIQIDDIPHITYDIAKPVTPLKAFFLPFIENLTNSGDLKSSIILGVPSCDLQALNLLDKIYLKDGLKDPNYQRRRENTILIGTDCHHLQDHCHCTSYGVKPFPEINNDVTLVNIEDQVLLQEHSIKGIDLFYEIEKVIPLKTAGQGIIDQMTSKRDRSTAKLEQKNKELPGLSTTKDLVKNADNNIWQEFSSNCVSCGACATICPTCTCFLLVDKPGFEKLRHIDACQYPGFEKVAAGNDPLKYKTSRFLNRYLCKYVWKPEKFDVNACTGCGRCIETCIGNINKNKLFRQLTQELIK